MNFLECSVPSLSWISMFSIYCVPPVGLQICKDICPFSSWEWPGRATSRSPWSLLAGCSSLCLSVYMCVTVFSVEGIWKRVGSIELICSDTQIVGEGNGNPLQCSCLENPRDGGAWCVTVYGVTQSWTRLKWLSSSSRLLLIWSVPTFVHISYL